MNKKTIFLSMIAMLSAGCAVAMQPDAPTQERRQRKPRPNLTILIPDVIMEVVSVSGRGDEPLRVRKHLQPLYSPETEERLNQAREWNATRFRTTIARNQQGTSRRHRLIPRSSYSFTAWFCSYKEEKRLAQSYAKMEKRLKQQRLAKRERARANLSN